jgi:gustatory receptor
LGSGAVNAPRRLFSQTYNTLHSPVFDFLDDLESFNEIQTDLKTASVSEIELLLELRRIYYNLCECSKCINFMYGLPVLIHIIRTATGLIAVLYSIGTIFDEHIGLYGHTTIIVWTVVLLGPIISLTIICDMAASKAKDIEHKLLALLLTDNVSSEMVGQLKLFCQQMSNDRIAFTAAGLFDVNLSFLSTFLTSITTYVVVMIQFKLH